MIQSLPTDIQHFIHSQVSAGRFPTEEAVVVRAVELLREREDDYQRLRADIQARLAAVDAGDYIELNGDEELAAFFEDLKKEVNEELDRERDHEQ